MQNCNSKLKISKLLNNLKFVIVILNLAFLILNFTSVFAADFSLNIPQYKEGEAGENLASFLQWAFVVAIAVAGILALLMIMIGGFQYITAAGSESRAGAAKSRIQNAIIGLILALCSYLILNTINPDLAKNLSLPGLETISQGDFKWEDYLPEAPKAGSEAHNVPDGAVCSSSTDCYCSRKCESWWKCPLAPTSPVFQTPEECHAKTICVPAPQSDKEKACESTYNNQTQTGTKHCTPMFDKISGEMLASLLSSDQQSKAGLRACNYICQKGPSEIETECYDQGYVCHAAYSNTCQKKSEFRESCKETTDCDIDPQTEQPYLCDQNKWYCTNANDSLPEGETLPESKQAGIVPGHSGLGKNCKDIYYLFNSAMLWVSSNLDGSVRDTDNFSMAQNKDACDGLASPKQKVQDGSTALCQPDMDQFIGGSLFTAPGETKKRIKWIEVGYAKRKLEGGGYYGNTKSCEESYGPAFYGVDKNFCESLSNHCPNQQLPTSDDYDTGACCGVLYTCGTQKATVPICRDLLATQGFKTADKITQPDIDRCIDELNLTMTKKEKEAKPMICCKFEGSVSKKTQGDNCDPQKSYECCSGLLCRDDGTGNNKCLESK